MVDHFWEGDDEKVIAISILQLSHKKQNNSGILFKSYENSQSIHGYKLRKCLPDNYLNIVSERR
jgi:hypothetical protein